MIGSFEIEIRNTFPPSVESMGMVFVQTLNKQYATGKISKEKFLEVLERLEKDSDQYETALDILKKRYAAGEITKEMFEDMKKEIVS